METDPKKYVALFDEAMFTISKREDKLIRDIQQGIGEKVGASRYIFEHWQRGDIPTIEKLGFLARLLALRGRMGREWLFSFLSSAGHHDPQRFVDQVYPAPKCSFCGRSKLEVGDLIRGPHRINICDEIADLRQDVCTRKIVPDFSNLAVLDAPDVDG
jgi:hypothetical protein